MPPGGDLPADTSVKWLQPTGGGTVSVKTAPADIDSASNLISIFGSANSGKSTIMNHLSETTAFPRQGGTKGCDVTPTLCQLPGCSSSLAFADTEGIGSNGGHDFDVMLFTPLMLSSSVTLFNWKGGFKKNDILNMMSIVIDATDKMDVGNAQEMVGGHLHILLRDSAPSERLQDMLLTQENEPGSERRDDIREQLKVSFASVTVWGIPAPLDSASALQSSFDLSECKADYQKQVNSLRSSIIKQVAAPKLFGSAALRPGNLFDAATEVITELNNGAVMTPLDQIREKLR